MARTMNMKKQPGLFIAWEKYQRRAELLAPLLESELVYFPNRMPSRWLRPIDYVAKFGDTLRTLRRHRPRFAVVQAPPHFSMLAPRFAGVPYVLDVHNGLFQSGWSRLPLVDFAIREARCVVVHNDEIRELAHAMHPGVDFLVLADPIESIRFPGLGRDPKKILFICSFDADEPLEAIVGTVEGAPDFEFVITANPAVLPSNLRERLIACPNLRLTGHLSVEDYQRMLCSSSAAIALTATEATQQSGACEALSSDTPLIVSRTALSGRLFGSWASLVENTASSIIAAIRARRPTTLDLASDFASELAVERARWNERVHAQLAIVLERMAIES